jgi:AcrR family transcriptional regulator
MPPRKTKRAYHHGDLRAQLVESALKLLRTRGPDALTLRGVARAAKVSQAAPYRHFKDRRALVAAVAEAGFRMLHGAMHDGMQRATGAQGFRQVAVAYVEFALAHPAEYRIMFGPELANHDDLPELRDASHATLGFVAQGIAGLQAAGIVGKGDPAVMAAALWSMLHGLVMLSLDGQTHGVAPSLAALVQEATHIMMFGMAPRG